MAERIAPGEIQQHRAYLYRYALLQVRDANRAEAVVQETLFAAIEGGNGFAGRSSVKTWLTGILKHKITNLFRSGKFFERWRPSVHLKACEGCRDFQTQMSFLRKVFRNHPVIRDRDDQ